jgi:1-phosphofructokinase family hexose kinase
MAIVTIGFNPAIDRILECPDFHVGGHQTATQVARLAAGKAANVSRALAYLGVDSLATGFVGMDEMEFFHTELMGAGPGRILCRFIDVSGRTRENISVLDPKRHIETHLRGKGFAVTPAERDLLEKKITHEIQAADVAVFAGSLCAGIGPEDQVKLINRCNQQGARVVVDCSDDALRAAVSAKLWLIKPNVEELRQLVGGAVDDTVQSLVAAARPLLENVQEILISRGARGAILLTREGHWSGAMEHPSPAVRTVGCGDHFLAGYVAERMAGRDPEAALRFAMAVGAARASSTDLAEITLDAVKQLLGQMTVAAV